MVIGYGDHLKELEAYCLENGVQMKTVEVKDRLIDLLTMTAALKDDKNVSGIIVWDSNDISDNEVEYFFWLLEFYRRKINVTVVNERYDIEKVALMQNIAKYGRQIAHTKGTVYARVKSASAGVNMGATPYGYTRVGNTLKIVPREAEAIRLAFRLRGKGVSWGETVDTLNREGYTSKKGEEITRSAVRVWINNKKLYQGYRREGDEWVEGSHEPIL